MPHRAVLSRWDDLALEKVTEMITQKVITGKREVLIQAYLKRGALVPLHAHPAEQMVYVLQGAVLVVVDGATFTVREGEVLRIPGGSPHQVEALDDTFVMTTGSGLLGESQPRPLRQTTVP
jgi:quercetin dioxygenase-like cupin family protein